MRRCRGRGGCHGWLHAATDWTHVGIEISRKTGTPNGHPKCVVARVWAGEWAWQCDNNETFI